MSMKKPVTKSKRWLTVLIIMVVVLSAFNLTIQSFVRDGLALSEPVRLLLLLVPAFFMYYLPLLRVNHFAKEENNKRLSIISRVLIIHFYLTVGLAAVLMIVYLFSAVL